MEKEEEDDAGKQTKTPYAAVPARTAHYQLEMGVTRQTARTQDKPNPKYAPQLPWEEKIFSLKYMTNSKK